MYKTIIDLNKEFPVRTSPELSYVLNTLEKGFNQTPTSVKGESYMEVGSPRRLISVYSRPGLVLIFNHKFTGIEKNVVATDESTLTFYADDRENAESHARTLLFSIKEGAEQQ